MGRTAEDVRQEVSKSYGEAISRPAAGGCCGAANSARKDLAINLAGYSAQELEDLPAEAADNVFGCGNPVSFAGMRLGDVVLDLGSGAGADLFLAAKKVGPTGRVIGVDMTDEMIAKANENIRTSGLAERGGAQRHHRGPSGRDRIRRLGHFELRHQPLAGKGKGISGDCPGTQAGRADARLGHRDGCLCRKRYSMIDPSILPVWREQSARASTSPAFGRPVFRTWRCVGGWCSTPSRSLAPSRWPPTSSVSTRRGKPGPKSWLKPWKERYGARRSMRANRQWSSWPGFDDLWDVGDVFGASNGDCH